MSQSPDSPASSASSTASTSSLPALRFIKFKGTGAWEVKSFNDDTFATLLKGKGISKSDISSKGITPCIRYAELYTTYSEVIETIISKTNIDHKNLFLSEGNEVIIPSSGETKVDIATASSVLNAGIALGGRFECHTDK